LFFLVFFFQAEDGIRDFHVTGVQTCALPISAPRRKPPPSPALRTAMRQPKRNPCRHKRSRRLRSRRPLLAPLQPPAPAPTGHARSEERRVGKEWRSRWAPDP